MSDRSGSSCGPRSRTVGTRRPRSGSRRGSRPAVRATRRRPPSSARLLIARGRYEEAEARLVPIAADAPRSPAALELGLLRTYLGRRAEARPHLDAVVDAGAALPARDRPVSGRRGGARAGRVPARELAAPWCRRGRAVRSRRPDDVGRALPGEVQPERCAPLLQRRARDRRRLGAGAARASAGPGQRQPAGRATGGRAGPDRSTRTTPRRTSIVAGPGARRTEPRGGARGDRPGARHQPPEPGGAGAAGGHRLPRGPDGGLRGRGAAGAGDQPRVRRRLPDRGRPHRRRVPLPGGRRAGAAGGRARSRQHPCARGARPVPAPDRRRAGGARRRSNDRSPTIRST